MTRERHRLRLIPGGGSTAPAEPVEPWAVHGSGGSVTLWVGGHRVRMTADDATRMAAALLVAGHGGTP